ncbi:hypothetical protein [Loktanella sp. R86503]|uniref:hypothetical protein n=1 Tax=Loktanella sp. R86503 TaxID=3093847 RepID=UPI0036D988A9
MAQNIDTGLLLRMEASLSKFEKQMAKATQVGTKTSTDLEKRFDTMGNRMAASSSKAATGLAGVVNIGGRGRFVLQNTAAQLGDIAVQMEMGTSASRVMAQQLPQLLGGFGALGGALGLVAPLLGTVAAVGIPIAAMFLSMGNETADLDDQLKNLNSSVDAYTAAAAAARTPTADLIEKYGEAEAAARTFLLALRDSAEAKSMTALAATLQTMATQFGGLSTAMQFSAKDARELGSEMDATVSKIADAFAVTNDEALALGNALAALQASASGTLDDQNAAAANLIAVLADIAPTTEAGRAAAQSLTAQISEAGLKGLELNATVQDVNQSMIEAATNAFQIATGIDGALPSADALLIRMRNIAGAAWDAAAAFTAAKDAEAKAALAKKLAPLGDDERGSQSDQVQSAGDNQAQRNLRVANARSSAYLNPPSVKAATGGRSRGAGRSPATTERPLMESVQQDITALQRQIEMVGMSKAEIAELTARYALLDEAKKRGIVVTDELSARIDAEAAQVGKLAGQYEQAQDKMAALEQLNQQWKDSLIDAAMGVEGAFEGVIGAIKRAAIEYALFGSGTFATIGGGGGAGGLIGAALGAIPGFATGTNNAPGGWATINERGGELVNLPSGAQVIPHDLSARMVDNQSRSQNMTQNIIVNGATGNSEIRQMVAQGVQQGNAQMRKEVPGIVSRHTKEKG